MTMKHLKKNISAEIDETVITNANLNNGVLTFTCKDFYKNELADNITVDLKDIKLRIYKLKANETLNDYKNTQDKDKILKRETHLFLVPVENQNDTHNTEGIYHEYIWSEDKNDFEMLGSTYLNLEPINTNIATLQSKVSSNESAITTLQGKVSSNESNITTLQGKVSSNESNINSLITANTSIVDAIRENANDISNLTSSKQGVNDTGLETTSKTIVGAINEINSKSVETVDSVTNGESKPVTSNAVYDAIQNINTDLPSELDFSNFLVIYEDGTSEQISLYEKNNSE